MDDTIAAISTPIGEGGIAIIRVSGPIALWPLQIAFFTRVTAGYLSSPRIQFTTGPSAGMAGN
jgi:tRNA U34 5-carboxymethylaminomethyl modifying GTPase MnmE/TrmE